MKAITVRNVHEALPEGLYALDLNGYRKNTRYGEVMKMEGPVLTEYLCPSERVIFWGIRDANPFFHLFESLWMLAGRRDVKFLKQFAKRMEEFSDDGKKFHGAYGHRWRKWFRRDQILDVIEILKNNPDDRRCVIEMWDAKKDLGKQGKDFPCNTHIYLNINKDGFLDLTTCSRSHDVIWGAYGANAVHMTVLQEYIAHGVGVPMGKFYQFSNDYHAYINVYEKMITLKDDVRSPYMGGEYKCPYRSDIVDITQIVDIPIKEWDEDLHMWLKDPRKIGLRSLFFLRVATPMFMAYKAHKNGDTKQALEIIHTQMPNKTDWKLASIEWLERRNHDKSKVA